ncbi:STAS domain protein [Planctomycetes bacterium Pan216]|uniref:STAS domain protein n=1 Tax=Kolteria novifilia TaxID=2527975 RepID=A0A518B4E4_9BACT|nr:STAS domain protein [Planctomycetes bacterium Pan216]
MLGNREQAKREFLVIEEVGDVLVVTFMRPRISGLPMTDAIKLQLRKYLLAHRSGKFLIDFRGVTYLSSAGVGVLVNVQERLHRRNGKMHLCRVGDEIEPVFSVPGFDQRFPIFPDRQSAITAFEHEEDVEEDLEEAPSRPKPSDAETTDLGEPEEDDDFDAAVEMIEEDSVKKELTETDVYELLDFDGSHQDKNNDD